MKLQAFTIVIALVGATTFTSCNKCVTCDSCPDDVSLSDDNGNEVESAEYCEKDFDSKENYDFVVEVAEEFGCSCK